MSAVLPTLSPPAPHRRAAFRVVAASTLGLTLAVAGWSTAEAHVRVQADSTTTGSFSALTFRVPNESAKAGTVKVEVQLPQKTPFVYVSSKPIPGWTVTTTEQKLPKPVEMEGTTITKAVRTVTWTADKDSAIAPGQYQEFSLSVGPLPAPGTVELPAVQTYSDGTVVSWDQPTPPSGEEPENPAPELVITAASAAPTPGSEASAATPSTAPPASAASTGSDSTARWLGGAALVVALAGLAVALVGRRRRAGGA